MKFIRNNNNEPNANSKTVSKVTNKRLEWKILKCLTNAKKDF